MSLPYDEGIAVHSLHVLLNYGFEPLFHLCDIGIVGYVVR